MTSRLLALAGWLAAGHAATFGVFWLLLSIPESSVEMLAASSLVAVVTVVLFVVVEAAAVAAWQPQFRAGHLGRSVWRSSPGVVAALLVVTASWWLAALAASSWSGHRGEIDAWLMLHFNWTNTGRFHTFVGWVLGFVLFVGLSVALSLASTVAGGGLRSLRRPDWIRSGVSPVRLLTLGAVLAVFVWLPWQSAHWRPGWLAPNWQEAAFAATKLGLIYLAANLGWALALGVHRPRP